ncbi:hypothetical protein D9611_008404 [Ephemerocybe angulata]|uniref:MYND-type domain-containing protein n=1 Tax=Ephemerocybe angulata TaxID=980116 RepID=A0A8H5BJ17_9AGAR|nr:hypothetical protein D9611_008404 [Tulosesus angulatus]
MGHSSKEVATLDNAPISEILDGAKRGSTVHLAQLRNRTLKNYTLEFMEVFLLYLQVPEPGFQPTRHQVECAEISFFALLEVVRGSQEYDESLADATGERLATAFKGILCWICCILNLRPDMWPLTLVHELPTNKVQVHDAVASLLLVLCQVHPSVHNIAVTDNFFIELCLMWWVATDQGEPLLYPTGHRNNPTDKDGEGRDLIICLMELAIQANPKGMATCIKSERICTPQLFYLKAARRMVLLSRINQLKHLSHYPNITAENYNLRCMGVLTDNVTIPDPALYEVMMETRIPELYMEALEMISSRSWLASSDYHKKKCFGEILHISQTVIAWTAMRASHVVSTTRGVVEKGLVRLLGNTMCVADEQQNKPWEFIFQVLVSLSTSPKIIALLDPVFTQYIYPKLHSLAEKNVAKGLVTPAISTLKAFASYLDKKTRIRICDNLDHRARTGAVAQGRRPQKEMTCSTCHSVVYCSKKCQREDWEARHRDECHAMAREYLETKRAGTRYWHNTRSFQLTILRRLYEPSSFMWNTSSRPFHNDYQGRRLVITLDAADISDPTTLDVLDDYVKNTTPLLAPHLLKRFNQFVERFKADSPPRSKLALARGIGKDKGTMGLVNGTFFFGDKEVNVVTMFKKSKNTGDPFCNFDVENSMVYTCSHRDRYGTHGGRDGHMERNLKLLYGPNVRELDMFMRSQRRNSS